MSEKEKEFNWHVDGLMEWIIEGIDGTEPLDEGSENTWGEIIMEAARRAAAVIGETK